MASICGSPVCAGGKPKMKFTYTGDYVVRKDGVVELLTSGTIVFLEPKVIDLFMVGGGGGGADTPLYSNAGFGGGGGGYTRTLRKVNVSANTSIAVTVGAGGTNNQNGGATAFGNNDVPGGHAPGTDTSLTQHRKRGGHGGSGGGGGVASNSDYGTGGSDGANGENGYTDIGGTGQGFTTREFGENSGKLYAGGGGGGRYMSAQSPVVSMGGSGGGGSGGFIANSQIKQAAAAGVANTGGGGGGGAKDSSSNLVSGASGGSGIVCFRESVELPELVGTWKFNARIYPPENPFDISSNYVIAAKAPSAGSGYDRIYIVNNKLMGKVTAGVAMSFYDFSTNTPASVFGYFRTDSVQNFTDEFRAWLASNATKQA